MLLPFTIDTIVPPDFCLQNKRINSINYIKQNYNPKKYDENIPSLNSFKEYDIFE